VTCTIPISALKSSPFLLPWGAMVWARITAQNLYGNSIESTEGNGAIILREPDSPVSLANNPSLTTGS